MRQAPEARSTKTSSGAVSLTDAERKSAERILGQLQARQSRPGPAPEQRSKRPDVIRRLMSTAFGFHGW